MQKIIRQIRVFFRKQKNDLPLSSFPKKGDLCVFDEIDNPDEFCHLQMSLIDAHIKNIKQAIKSYDKSQKATDLKDIIQKHEKFEDSAEYAKGVKTDKNIEKVNTLRKLLGQLFYKFALLPEDTRFKMLPKNKLSKPEWLQKSVELYKEASITDCLAAKELEKIKPLIKLTK